MGDVVAMDVLNPVDDLLEVEPGFVLSQIGLNVVIQLALAGQFHDDEDVIGGVEDFVEFYDVGVVDKLEDFDFSLDLKSDIKRSTLEIMFLFFIFFLLMIFTATSRFVKSCFATMLGFHYFLL